MSAKEAVLQAIHRLPDDVDYRAIAEEIAFLAALEQGDQDIHSGRVAALGVGCGECREQPPEVRGSA